MLRGEFFPKHGFRVELYFIDIRMCIYGLELPTTSHIDHHAWLVVTVILNFLGISSDRPA